MSNEVIIVSALVLLSVAGIMWPKVAAFFLKTNSQRIPGEHQVRMDLIRDLLEACEGCEAETKAVSAAGDVIAKHWRDEDHE
jgi:hypothetical protein